MDKLKFWGVAIAAIAFMWMLGPSAEERAENQQRINKLLADEAGLEGSATVQEELPPDPGTPVEFPKEPIHIQSERGKLPLVAGIADTPFNKRQGLMHYKQWPAGMHGLLFLFDQPAVISMWMKNTHLSLDMVFIDKTGKIVHIAENTTPLSEEHISSTQPALAVFEIPAGSAKQWQIHVGDRIEHPHFALSSSSQ